MQKTWNPTFFLPPIMGEKKTESLYIIHKVSLKVVKINRRFLTCSLCQLAAKISSDSNYQTKATARR